LSTKFVIIIRMLSTAQKPSNDGFVREHLRDGDGQPQRRKPMTIDVTTVVGITVGAFLFILIGTGTYIVITFHIVNKDSKYYFTN